MWLFLVNLERMFGMISRLFLPSPGSFEGPLSPREKMVPQAAGEEKDGLQNINLKTTTSNVNTSRSVDTVHHNPVLSANN